MGGPWGAPKDTLGGPWGPKGPHPANALCLRGDRGNPWVPGPGAPRGAWGRGPQEDPGAALNFRFLVTQDPGGPLGDQSFLGRTLGEGQA